MVVKVVGRNGRERLYPCHHVEVTWYLPGSVALADHCQATGDSEEEAAGVKLELVNRNPASSRQVLIPTDGAVAYAMNDRGATVGTYRWPPVEKQKKEVAS